MVAVHDIRVARVPSIAMCRAFPVLCVLALLVLVQTWPTQGHAAENEITVLPPSTKTMAKRIAIVVGNGGYENIQKLRNPRTDAEAIASKLAQLGFEVVLARDVGRRGMNQVINNFLDRIEPGSEALVYYSGHGVELNGSNYLLPIDIPATNQERMLREEGINLTDLLLDLQARNARVNVVILDACRDNPFRVSDTSGRTRSLGSKAGLGRVDPPQGTFVIFAAGVGEQAIDNLGDNDIDPNGLFTRELLKSLDQPNLEIRPLVQQLRAKVRQVALAAGTSVQTPSYYDQLLGEFYINSQAEKPNSDRDKKSEDEIALIPVPKIDSPSDKLDGKSIRLAMEYIWSAKSGKLNITKEFTQVLKVEFVKDKAIFSIEKSATDGKDDGEGNLYMRVYKRNQTIDGRTLPENASLFADESNARDNSTTRAKVVRMTEKENGADITLDLLFESEYRSTNRFGWKYFIMTTNSDTSYTISVTDNMCILKEYVSTKATKYNRKWKNWKPEHPSEYGYGTLKRSTCNIL
jgi:Caspase domain